MQFPIVEMSPGVGSILLSVLSGLYVILTGLVAGGSVFMLVAHRRGIESIDLRWNEMARRIASWVLNLILSGVALTGISLWLVSIFIHPQAVFHLQRIFFGPLVVAWGFLFFGVVLLAVYVFGWNQRRNYSPAHFAAGAGASVCLWMASAITISLKSFTLTSGAWPNSESVWSAVFNPSAIPAFLLWAAVAVILAGSAGLIYARCQKDNLWRYVVIQGAGTFTAVAALVGSVASLVWLVVLSFSGNLEGLRNEIPPVYFGGGVAIIAVELSILLVLTAVRRPKIFGNILCSIAVVSAVTLVAGIQAVQDKSQGPYLIQNYMYRNGILVSDVGRLKVEGLWKQAAWKPEEKEYPKGAALGAFSFRAQCRTCHADWQNSGTLSAMPPFRFKGDAMRYMDQISKFHPFFPDFAGTSEEKRAVALYIEGLLKKSGVSLVSRPLGSLQPGGPKLNTGIKTKKKTFEAKKNLSPPEKPALSNPPLPPPPRDMAIEKKANAVPEQNISSPGESRSSMETPQAGIQNTPDVGVKLSPASPGAASPQANAPVTREAVKTQEPHVEEEHSKAGDASSMQSTAPPVPQGAGGFSPGLSAPEPQTEKTPADTGGINQ